ncbi:MAG: MFS transporter [Actinomycetia bacterium]|nr:MFS transporter [Actinomycetes bacterium]
MALTPLKRLVAPLLPREYKTAARMFSPDAWHYLVAAALQSAGMGVLGTVFAIYIKDVGMTEAVVGDVEGALALSSAITCLALPPLVSRIGYPRLIMLAGFALGASRLGQAFAPTAVLVVGLGLLYGVGEGMMQVLSTAFLSEAAPARARTHLFTVDYATRVGSMFIGSLIGGYVPHSLEAAGMPSIDGLRAAIAAGAILMLASAMPARRIERERPAGSVVSYRASVRAFSSWNRLARLIVPEVATSFGAALSMPFIALFLKHQLGATVGEVGVIQAVSSLGMAVAAFGAPWLSRRMGLVGTVVVTELLSLPFLVAVPLATSLPVAAALLWVRGILMNMSWPVYNQLATEGVPPADRPLVVGWVRFGWSVAWLGGSVLGGRLMERSYVLPWYITAVLYAAGALATFVLLREVRAETVVESHA